MRAKKKKKMEARLFILSKIWGGGVEKTPKKSLTVENSLQCQTIIQNSEHSELSIKY